MGVCSRCDTERLLPLRAMVYSDRRLNRSDVEDLEAVREAERSWGRYRGADIILEDDGEY